MNALHGGQAKHDRSDAQTIAVRLRGGRLPQAYVYPAEMRATRDLLRRRMPLMWKRAEWLTHIQHTHSQDNLPELGKNIAYQANRPSVAERFPDPAVQNSSEVDRALIDHDDHLRRAMARAIRKTAKPHDTNTRSRLRTVPGLGEILRLVRRYDIHDIQRVPRVQACVSDGRRVTWAKASAGKRSGPSGAKIGHASLTWAFAEAAILCWRATPAGQKSLGR